MKGIIALCALLACLPASAQNLTVGSKRFTESLLLGGILAQSVGAPPKPGLGTTPIELADGSGITRDDGLSGNPTLFYSTDRFIAYTSI